MKILLIQPYAKYEEYNTYAAPLGIAYIAAVIEKMKHEVAILDYTKSLMKNKTFSQLTAEYLKKYQPSAVGISVMTPMYGSFKEIVNDIRSYDRNIPIFVGGPHPTALPEETICEVPVDFVVRGEGEKTVSELMEYFAGMRSLRDIKGLTYMQDGKIAHNTDRELIKNLDEIPFPARHLLPMDEYQVANMISSRGCPFRCVYCFKTEGPNYRTRNAKSVVDEMEELTRKYNKNFLYFFDDLFTLDNRRVIEICDQIIERKLDVKFRCNSRVDCITKEVLNKLKEAGCISIHFGVESGDSNILMLMKKQISKEQVRKAFDMARKAGISTVAYFMLGFPWDTRESIKNTIDFAKELTKDSIIVQYIKECPAPMNAYFNIVTPLPGTDLWKIAQERKMIDNISYDNLFIAVPSHFEVEDFKGKPIFESSELSRKDIVDYFRMANEQVILSRYPVNYIKYLLSKNLHKLHLDFIINYYKNIKNIEA